MDSLPAERFGCNLWRRRRRAGLTQIEVANLAELHRVAVGEVERGQRMPRLDTILKLSAAVESSSCDLLEGVLWLPGRYIDGSFESDDGASWGRPDRDSVSHIANS